MFVKLIIRFNVNASTNKIPGKKYLALFIINALLVYEIRIKWIQFIKIIENEFQQVQFRSGSGVKPFLYLETPLCNYNNSPN